MTVLNIPKAFRAAAVAVALAGSTFVAVPAVQAQDADFSVSSAPRGSASGLVTTISIGA